MLFTATAEPSESPPRVRLDLDTENDDLTFTAITIRRDGVAIRAVAPVGSSVSIAYDYDAPYDVACVYTVEATVLGVLADWTETWASVASWSGSDWSTSAGTATSSVEGATITRAVSSGVLGRVDFTDVDWTKVRILNASDVTLVEVWVGDGQAVVTGSGDPVVSSGSGPFSLTLDEGVATLSGAGYVTKSVEFSGTPTKVRLVAALGPNPMLIAFGSHGAGNGQFSVPEGIAVDGSGNVYVADYGNSRVQKFNSSGVYQSQFGTFGTGDGQFQYPTSVAVDGSGNIWVVDSGNNRVQKFNSSGTYQSQFGTYGTGNGQFKGALGIALDGSGNIYVTDRDNYRVQKFNSSGIYQSQFGSFGTGNGQFRDARAIDIDGSGNIWVADATNNRVQKFNSSGVYQSQFGAFGTGNGQFDYPWGIGVDGSSNIYVVDSENNRVQKFGPDPQPAVVDDVAAWLSLLTTPQTGSDTETLTGIDAMWLIHPVTPSLSLVIDNGPDGDDLPCYATEETSQRFNHTANGRNVLEIEGSRLPVVVTTGPRRTPDRTLQLHVADFDTRDLVLAALDSQDPILLRSPQAWDLDMPEGWFSAGDVEVARFQGPALHRGQESTITLPLTPVRTPVIEPTFGVTYADSVIAGGTYGDAVVTGRTYLERLTG